MKAKAGATTLARKVPGAGLREQPASDQKDRRSNEDKNDLPGSFLLSRDERQVFGQCQIALQKCKRAGQDAALSPNVRARPRVRQFVPAALRNRSAYTAGAERCSSRADPKRSSGSDAGRGRFWHSAYLVVARKQTYFCPGDVDV